MDGWMGGWMGGWIVRVDPINCWTASVTVLLVSSSLNWIEMECFNPNVEGFH